MTPNSDAASLIFGEPGFYSPLQLVAWRFDGKLIPFC